MPWGVQASPFQFVPVLGLQLLLVLSSLSFTHLLQLLLSTAAARTCTEPWQEHTAHQLPSASSVTNTTTANHTGRTSGQTKGSVNTGEEQNDMMKYYLRLLFLHIKRNFSPSSQRKHQERSRQKGR